MNSFLKKIEEDINTKILSCIKGKPITKPFDKVYEEVRGRVRKTKDSSTKNFNKTTMIYSEGEASIYHSVIQQFLEENPEILKEE